MSKTSRILTVDTSLLLPFKLERIVLISEKGYEMLRHPLRLNILSLIGGGASSVSEISRALKVNKGIISRHLKMLWKLGVVERVEKSYKLTSIVCLVYSVSKNESLNLTVKPRGGFFDPNTKIYLLVDGATPETCRTCKNLLKCIDSVKRIAKKLKIKLRAESPIRAYLEAASTIVERSLKKATTLKITLR